MEPVAASYLPVAIFLAVAVTFAVITLNIGILLRPRKPGGEKGEAYECGNEPVGEATVPIFPRYYFFAMLLVLFDVEAVFLIPWALGASSLGGRGLLAVFLFFVVIMGGYLYLWRKGDLSWD
jgi:NADH-quinone oxidoreductase subunit A